MSECVRMIPSTSIEWSERYLHALLERSRSVALGVIAEAYEAGLSIPDIYEEIIRRAQYEVGRLWEDNIVSVADEHVATAISQLAVAQLYLDLPRAPANDQRVLVACVEDELHELGARMLADYCEVRGYDVVYLGANVPTDSLIQAVHDVAPDIVALSVTMGFNLPALYDAVRRIRSAREDTVQIIAGGQAIVSAGLEPGAVHATLSGGGAMLDLERLESADPSAWIGDRPRP